jgi:hypothetical protein
MDSDRNTGDGVRAPVTSRPLGQSPSGTPAPASRRNDTPEAVPSRRRFLIVAALAAAAVPIGMRMMGEAHAAALTKLPVDNTQAKALGYAEDAGTVKHASYKPGSTCSNCQFFTAATGACALFAGFSVSPKGWCSAWAKKPG